MRIERIRHRIHVWCSVELARRIRATHERFRYFDLLHRAEWEDRLSSDRTEFWLQIEEITVHEWRRQQANHCADCEMFFGIEGETEVVKIKRPLPKIKLIRADRLARVMR